MEEREAIALGGLLHDIGKFMQRADLSLSQQSKEMERFLCPQYRGHYSHQHVLWTNEFFERFFPPSYLSTEELGEVSNLAAYHHRPETELQRLIQRADVLSAGYDRTPDAERSPRKERLYALLEEISLEERADLVEGQLGRYRFGLSPLMLERDIIFPRSREEGDLTADYKRLWEAFAAELPHLPTADFSSLYNSLYFLLEKYTWCIPSAVWGSRPDISLFDHSRVTAALATALYETGGAERLLLIEGDISGIQNFIYRLASPSEAQKGMAKRLRGRSFYLDLLTRSLSVHLRAALDLLLVNELWVGGGRFLLLAPDTSRVQKGLKEAQEGLDEWFYHRYHGDLYLALAVEVVEGEELKDFAGVLRRLQARGARAKGRKLAHLKEGRMIELEEKVCIVCGRDFRGEGRICERCQSHLEIGAKLPQLEGGGTLGLLSLGFRGQADLLFDFPRHPVAWRLLAPGDSPDGVELLLAVNRSDFLPHELGPSAGARGYGFTLLANRVPRTEQGQVMEFGEMAKAGEGSDFLGFLRMDVDDLGAILAIGIPREDRSISRLATLSRTVELFFEGYLNRLCAKYRTSYVVYSGGDDLFIVGRWDELIELAMEIRDEFSAYACGNPDLHLSGGLFLSRPHFPVGRAARAAGEFLEEAKGYRDGEGSKDAFALFSQVGRWEDLVAVKDYGDRLIKLLPEKLTRGFFQQLLAFHRQFYQREGYRVRWLSRLSYLTHRTVEEGTRAELERLKEPRMMRYVPLLAAYVLNKTRR